MTSNPTTPVRVTPAQLSRGDCERMLHHCWPRHPNDTRIGPDKDELRICRHCGLKQRFFVQGAWEEVRDDE